MRKYHELKNNNKNIILIPESAHGTNPASVILAGYKPVELATDNINECKNLDVLIFSLMKQIDDDF